MAIPTLQDIAQTYKTQVQLLAPVKTGTLKNNIRVSYKKLGDFKYTFDLSSVPYIIWWNAPTISRTIRNAKTGNRDKINFAYKGANSTEVKDIIRNYQVKAVIDVEVLGNMRNYFENEGYNKVKQVFRKK